MNKTQCFVTPNQDKIMVEKIGRNVFVNGQVQTFDGKRPKSNPDNRITTISAYKLWFESTNDQILTSVS